MISGGCSIRLAFEISSPTWGPKNKLPISTLDGMKYTVRAPGMQRRQ
jgi:hypothetical protein